MTKTVLIIEDHEDFRAVVRDHLEKQDFKLNIIEASTGELGILKAMKERPDIVLMDIRLPNMNGLEAASRIKAYLPKVKIIVLTMFETQTFREVFRSKDITAYIGKSELFDRLIPVMLEYIYPGKTNGKSK